MADIARIEERLDRVAAGNTAVSDQLGGIVFQNMTEVMEFSKLMSLAGNAVPKHLQGNPGMCLAVCVQALEWRFSPFAVANKSYEVQGRLCFESQLVHALIEQRAPIRGRLQHKFEGEGDDRKCIVTAILRETGETMEYTSPPFSKITPKNSPLWKTKPDLQLYYNTSRDFCRAYFPDVLLGVYAQDELRDHLGPDNAKDVNARPSVGERLKGSKGRGFSASHVERETRGVVEETSAPGGASTQTQHREQDSNAETVTTPVEAAQVDPAGETPAPSNIDSSRAPSPAETDTPATSPSPGVSVAGNPSSLPEGWQATYVESLTRISEKPKSLATRRTEALKAIGGTPSDSDRLEMGTIEELVKRRNAGELKPDDFKAQLREIMPAGVEA
jgi:hypothetical protein